MAKANVQTKSALTAKVAAKLNAACEKVNAEILSELTAAPVTTFNPQNPPKEFKAALRQYKKARAKVAKAKAEQDEAAEFLKAAMTAAGIDEISCNDGHAIYREVETTRVNSKELRERCPLIFAQFSEISVSRPLKVF